MHLKRITFFLLLATTILTVAPVVSPCLAQDGLVDRVANLETKVDRILAILEKQQAAAAPDPFVPSQAAAFQPAPQLQAVCDSSGCRVIQSSASCQSFESNGGGGCASGSCGVGGRLFHGGLIHRILHFRPFHRR
jgi:hypothetical protein